MFGLFKSLLCSEIGSRVVERQMDGCMAHYCSRERWGRIIGLTGNDDLYPRYRIRWDDTGEVTEFPRDAFRYSDETGALTRLC